MLKYKQIWYGIKPTRWLIKFNLTQGNSPTNAHLKSNKNQTPNQNPFESKPIKENHKQSISILLSLDWTRFETRTPI